MNIRFGVFLGSRVPGSRFLKGEGSDLEHLRGSAMETLTKPDEVCATPQEARADRRRIKALEKDIGRKKKLALRGKVWVKMIVP